ncbi:MAG: uridine kinase [Lachnospiraceae bacterium]|nr:uridine kinase [Lachnospiraceae bacterium]
MSNCLVIGVAGGSGSGKTTLTKNLTARFGDRIAVVHHDNYYHSHHDMTFEERCRLNYDCPEAFENRLMVEQLRLLKQGRSVECPIYDYTIHDRVEETETIESRPIILVEGILIFAEKELTDLMDIKIFVDTDADIRLARRIKRDIRDRGRTVESVIEQWRNTVKPMYEAYVEPSKKLADIIVPEGGKNIVALEMIYGRLERHMKA